MMRGSTPTTADDTILAKGSSPCADTADSDATRIAAEPSFNPEEFPAVTLPPSFLNAGRSLVKPL